MHTTPDHFQLGNTLHMQGNFAGAVEAYRQALRLQPERAEIYYNLSHALRNQRQPDAAMAALREAIRIRPTYAAALNDLGNFFKQAGHFNEAKTAYESAIRADPGWTSARTNLANLFVIRGERDQANTAYQEALQINPHDAGLLYNFGVFLQENGKTEESIACYRRSIEANPHQLEAHQNLAIALSGCGALEEARRACEEAIRLQPDYPQAYNTLSEICRRRGELDEAVAASHQAIHLRPDYAEAWNNLGNHHRDLAQPTLALDCLRKARALQPDSAAIHSNLIFAAHYDPEQDAAALLAECREWDRCHAAPLRSTWPDHRRDFSPERPLRIGYVSADLYGHVVGQCLAPLLSEHNPQQVETFCYADVTCSDQITRRLKSLAGHWRDIAGVSDAEAARRIQEDRIDILVDLGLHTDRNRLLLFARKPAPIQVSYLGYCGTTGLAAMDYRLSDPQIDSTDADLADYSEKTVRLSESYWCYAPIEPVEESGPLPAAQSGFVTFGCLNNSSKLSSGALDLWLEILSTTPGSRLLLHAPAGSTRQGIIERAADRQISFERLEFVERQPWKKYLQTWTRIDIGLDPFPYGGGITTCDALWMGVPVVTLSGRTAVGRGARSILSNVGLPELIASHHQQYRQIATELAGDLHALETLRTGLRRRMEQSPLCDAPRFTRGVEGAFREMWRRWCAALK